MVKIKQLQDKIESNKNILKLNIEINRKQNGLYYNKLIKQLKNQTVYLNDTEQKILELTTLLQNSKKDVISESTSISDLHLFKSIDSIDGWRENIINQEQVKEMEDDELMNECYDTIPLNNLKKSASSWLI